MTLRQQAADRWRRFVFVTTCVAAAVLVLYVVAIRSVLPADVAMQPAAHLHTCGVWLMLVGVVLVISRISWQRRVTVMPVLLVLLALVDAVSTSRLARTTMYRGSAADWLRLDEVHRSQVDLTARGLLRDVDAGANVAFISKTPGFRGYSGLAGPLFELYANDPVLRASATGRDRLWFSQSAVIVERTEPCFEAFRARARQLGEVPIVLHTTETMRRGYVRDLPAAATMPCDSPSTAVAAMRLDAAAVNVVQYRPTRLTFDVDVPRAGWLLVTDSWSHGWQATVNGRRAAIAGGNFIFRAVRVQPGRNRVDFRYEVFGYPWLLILSWGTLAATAGGLRVARRLLYGHRQS